MTRGGGRGWFMSKPFWPESFWMHQMPVRLGGTRHALWTHPQLGRSVPKTRLKT